jgi:hypothetical protein
VKTGEETLKHEPRPRDKERREIEVKTPGGWLVSPFRSSGLDAGEVYDPANNTWVRLP